MRTVKGGAGGGVGRGRAGERPRLLWCCGGTRGSAVAQERAWAPAFVEMCGAARAGQGGGRRNGKGGVWQLHTSSTTHKHNCTQAHAQTQLHTRASSVRNCSLSVSHGGFKSELCARTSRRTRAGSGQGTLARACGRAWAGPEVDDLHGWTVYLDLEEEEVVEEEEIRRRVRRS